MRQSIWIVTAIFLFAAIVAPGVARADDITYNYEIADGPITVTGTILTDGTLGSISPCSNFIGGDGIITDATHSITSTLAAPNVECLQTGPSGWTATATTISFNFDAAASSTEFASTVTGNDTTLTFTSDGSLSVVDSNGDTVSVTITGTPTVAATPEPGTLILLLIGLGSLGAMAVMRNRKARGLPQAS